jgi:hypothetical protein
MGESKYGFSRIWKVFFDLFTLRLILNFSNRPMAWFGMLGFFSIFIALSLVGLQVITHDFFLVWAGVAMLFGLNGFILFSYGLICEYAVKYGNNKIKN